MGIVLLLLYLLLCEPARSGAQIQQPSPPGPGVPTYGIVCDGITQTAPAIQAALDTVPVGTRLVLPAGVCLLNQTLVVPRALTLEGAGVNHTYLRQTVPDIPVVSVGPGGENFALAHFTMDHTGTPVAGGDGLVVDQYFNRGFLAYLAADRNWRGFVLGCMAFAPSSHLEANSNNSHGFEFVYSGTTCGVAQWQIRDSLAQFNQGAGFFGHNTAAASGLGPFLESTVTFANQLGGYVFLGSPGHPISDILLRSVLSSTDNGHGIYMDTYGPNHMIDQPWIETTGAYGGLMMGTPPVASVANPGPCLRLTVNNWAGLIVQGGRFLNCAWSGFVTEAPYSGLVGAYLIGNGRALHADIANRSGVHIAANGVTVSGNTFGFSDGNTVAGSTVHYVTLQGALSEISLGHNTYAPGIAVANIVSTSAATITNMIPPVLAAGLMAYSNNPGARGVMIVDTTGAGNYLKVLRVANGQLEVVGTGGPVISRLSDEGTPGWPNRRGQVTIADAANTATVTLSPVEPDASYFVLLTVSSSVGPTPAGALSVAGVTKAAGSFGVTISAAPGAGKSVTFDWLVHR